MDETPEQREKNLLLRFQEIFDVRYVFKREYDRLEKGIFWVAALFITSIVSIVIAYVTHR